MSSDPKKPFDSPPAETPAFLNKDLSLDRRRRVPSFEELSGKPPVEAPTDPNGVAPGPQAAAMARQVPPNLQPRVAAQPSYSIDLDDEDEPVTRVGSPNAKLLAQAAPAPDDDDEPVTRVGSPNATLLARAKSTGAQPVLVPGAPARRPENEVTVPVPRPAPAPLPQGRRPTADALTIPAPAVSRPAAPAAPAAPARAAAPAPGSAQPTTPARGAVPPAAAAAAPAARTSVPTPGAAAPARAAPAARTPVPPPGGASPAPAGVPRAPAAPGPAAARPAGSPAPPPAARVPVTAPPPAPLPAVRAAAPAPAAPARPAAPQAPPPLAPMPRIAAQQELARPWEPSDALTIANAGAPRGDDEATGVLTPKRAPPSPVDFAQRAHAAPLPQVTASPASVGASAAPRHELTMPAQPFPAPARAPALQVEDDEPELITAPARRAELPLPPPTTTPAPKPQPLPEALLVTQPGIPGPFAKARKLPDLPAVPERAPSVPELPAAVEPAPELGAEEPPSFGDTSLRAAIQSDTVTASPAALWRRVGAWLVDLGVVVGLVCGFLAAAVQVIAPKQGDLLHQLQAVALPGVALAGLLAFVYAALFAFLWRGRTPGRLLLGIRLVDTTGHAPGPLRSLVRAGLSLVSFALFLSGFWLALFDRHGQTLHDKLTRTFVVRLQDA